MKRMIAALLLLAAPALVAPVWAQDRSHEPSPDEIKIAKACRMDVHLYCADARLRQECLVTRWTKISAACQNALATPMKSEGGG